jgi:ankyrin repeat protein
MWESARAGSTHAQGEAMHYVVRSRDYQTSTASERRDWSLACLTHKHRFGWDLLSLVDAMVCEKGLRAAVFAHHVAVQRRMLRKKSVRSVAQVLRDSLAPHQLTALSSTISLERVSTVIAEDDLDSLAKITETNIEDAQLRALFLRSLLEYATEAERKQLIFMLLSRFCIDATATDPATGRSALSTSIFEDRNDAVIWMTDSGVDRKLFGSQHIFGRVVCNSTYTMINTYVQLCHTYYGDLITKKLLNDGAPNKDGSTLPPPIALAILSSNTSAFEVLLRYDVDIEQRYGAWAPLLLSVARGLPLFCAMLIEKGASLDSVTADDTAMTIVHVLASSEVFSITGEDDLLYKVFDRPRGQLFLSPVTPSQERRFADHLIFSILKQLDISFNQKDSSGKDPMHVAIESGNLWIAAFLENPNWMTEANELPKVAQLQDFQGRTLLFYAIEDDDFELAERLLQQGCQIEVSDHAGKTVLHEAAEQNNIVRLDFCISHDAPVAHLDFLGWTALTFAIAHGSISMCEKILANAGPTILLTRTAADDNFMHAALKFNEDTLVVFLVEYYIENQKTNGLPAISELMAQRDVLGRTPLHHACHPRKRVAADASTGSVFLKLISLSPDISPRDNVGDTPLHDAAETADRGPHVLSCAHALIRAGADVDAQNVFGNTPLHYAYQRQQRKSVELLIASGADRKLKNKQGFAPEEWGNAIKHDPAVGRSADAATHDLIHERSRWVDVETAVTRVKEENERRSRKARLDFLEANGAWAG